MARLADDSNEGKNQSEFFLVIRPHQAVAELMAECPSCGAITSFALELAWQLDVVSCSECNRALRLDEYDLQGFRQRLADAMTRVDALLGGPSPEGARRFRVAKRVRIPRKCTGQPAWVSPDWRYR